MASNKAEREMNESNEADIRTLVALDEEGELMDRIHEDKDQINVHLNGAEKNLTKLEKYFFFCVCPPNNDKKYKENAETGNSKIDGTVVSGQPTIVEKRNGNRLMTTSYITKITNKEREYEMGENRRQRSPMKGNTEIIATDVVNKVNRNNRQLDRMIESAQSTANRIKSARERTLKLLHK